jgi:hypothetical protein
MARGKNNAAVKVAETAVVETVVEAPAVVYPTTEQMIADGLTTKSARIRKLHSLGMSTGDIARQECNGLYQHAFNVIKKPLKKVVSATPEAPAQQEEPAGESEETQTQEA